MKKKKNNKSKQAKAQEITNKILKNNDEKNVKDNDATMRFEAAEEFDSLDFSPESWKKE